MRQWISITGFVIFTMCPATASKLKGIVLLNEISGTAVDQVTIISSGANLTVTTSDGLFTLDFTKKHPGDKIHIVVQKAGYVVVNDAELDQTLPPDSDRAKEVVILICMSNREKWQRRYHQHKNLELLDDTVHKAPDDQEEYLVRVATMESTVGDYHRSHNRMDDAISSYTKVFKAYSELAELNAQIYKRHVAQTLRKLGDLHRESGQMLEARRNYQEAVKIYQQLVAFYPQFRPEVVRIESLLKTLK